MAPITAPVTRTDFGTVKATIHRKLIQKLNLDRLTEVNREDVRREVAQILEALVVGESTPMNLQERERLAQEVLDEVFGLGPARALACGSHDLRHSRQHATSASTSSAKACWS